MIDIKSAIVCDLVRTEDTGKQILIGVYVGDISVSHIPSKINLTFWVDIAAIPNAEEIELEVRFDVPGADKPSLTSMFLALESEQNNLLILEATFDVLIPGPLVVSLRRQGGRWIKALTKNIVLTPPSA
jgi:hypothetical protein